MMKSLLLIAIAYATFSLTVSAETSTTLSASFSSPTQQARLLELYTSEGCSSCPPADEWLSTLKDHPQLWKTFIPVAFRVDYWNYLGWKDEFSKAEYTQRQRNYARFSNLSTIYTPGFLLNGKEWRSRTRNRTLNEGLGENVGPLDIQIADGVITAHFRPEKPVSGPLTLNIAWMGFDIVTKVQNGENEGRDLQHDFVSFQTEAIQGVAAGDIYRWRFTANVPIKLPEKKGVAFWITDGNNPTPVQATGGWF